MSETLEQDQGINININNSDSNAGSTSFLDRIFDIGLKLIIPLGLILALIAVVVLVRVVLPLVNFVGGIDFNFLAAFGSGGALIAGVGSLAGWLIGR
tara:strand:- start:113 stop:403 length:291 start_codon:yes stop_codon:yes gene_type:complete